MRLRECVVALLFVSLPACGSDDNAPPHGDGGAGDVAPADAGAGDEAPQDARPDGPYPAPHAALPQVVKGNGPVMSAPKIVAMAFAKDPDLPALQAVVHSLTTDATWWSSASSQYGVGPIASGTVYVVNETAPTTIADSEIQAWLASKFSAGVDAGAGADA